MQQHEWTPDVHARWARWTAGWPADERARATAIEWIDRNPPIEPNDRGGVWCRGFAYELDGESMCLLQTVFPTDLD